MKRVTKEEFNERIERRFPEERFTILEYTGTGKPLSIRCDTCGEVLKINKANNFLAPTKAHGCVNCFGLWKERENKLKIIKEKYDILETSVKDTHTYYHVKCKNCGHERNATLASLFKFLDCGCVTGVFRGRTGEEFINHVNQHCEDSGYELISEYKNQITKVLLRHKECGFIWSVRPADVINGKSSCPKCGRNESRAVRYITSLLTDSGIVYEKEKTLEESRQRFDFYLENETRKIAIEYNGAQHYRETPFFKGTSLEKQQERDQRKREYCKQHDIQLIEIPYTCSLNEIKELITQIINEFND